VAPVETDDDRLDLLDENEFGTLVSLPLSAGGTKSVKAIFDRAWTDLEVLDGLPVSETHPSLLLRASELSGVNLAGTLTIGAESFVIREPRPDGTGMTRLVLRVL